MYCVPLRKEDENSHRNMEAVNKIRIITLYNAMCTQQVIRRTAELSGYVIL